MSGARADARAPSWPRWTRCGVPGRAPPPDRAGHAAGVSTRNRAGGGSTAIGSTGSPRPIGCATDQVGESGERMMPVREPAGGVTAHSAGARWAPKARSEGAGPPGCRSAAPTPRSQPGQHLGELTDGHQGEATETQRHQQEPPRQRRTVACGRSTGPRKDGIVHPSVPTDTARPCTSVTPRFRASSWMAFQASLLGSA